MSPNRVPLKCAFFLTILLFIKNVHSVEKDLPDVCNRTDLLQLADQFNEVQARSLEIALLYKRAVEMHGLEAMNHFNRCIKPIDQEIARLLDNTIATPSSTLISV